MHPNLATPTKLPLSVPAGRTSEEGGYDGQADPTNRRLGRIGRRFRVPPSMAGPKEVFLTCHYCGYGPAEVPAGGRCPKCGGYSWERYALSVRLLPQAP